MYVCGAFSRVVVVDSYRLASSSSMSTCMVCCCYMEQDELYIIWIYQGVFSVVRDVNGTLVLMRLFLNLQYFGINKRHLAFELRRRIVWLLSLIV